MTPARIAITLSQPGGGRAYSELPGTGSLC
jgi:hypothetical protein